MIDDFQLQALHHLVGLRNDALFMCYGFKTHNHVRGGIGQFVIFVRTILSQLVWRWWHGRKKMKMIKTNNNCKPLHHICWPYNNNVVKYPGISSSKNVSIDCSCDLPTFIWQEALFSFQEWIAQMKWKYGEVLADLLLKNYFWWKCKVSMLEQGFRLNLFYS